MKRSLFISTLLVTTASFCAADDIILNGADWENAAIVYTGKETLSSTKNTPVKGAALNSDGEVRISGAASIEFSQNKTVNTYTSAHDATVVPTDLAAGGAIQGDTVTISGNEGCISFTDNELRAKTTNDARTRVRGGAIKGREVYINNNTVSSINFSGNKAFDDYIAWDDTAGKQVDKPKFSGGGAVYADATLTISGNKGAAVTFSNNEAGKGGAVSGGYKSAVTISGNGMVSFTENVAQYGGAAYNGVCVYEGGNVAGYSEMSITGNAGVLFRGNRARNNGGALYNQSNSTLSISNNQGDVSFSGNSAEQYGGAIRGQASSTIALDNNRGTVSFTGNHVLSTDVTSVYGGAISLDSNSTLSLSNNDSISLSDNSVQTNSSAYGGAVAMYKSTLNITGNINGVSLTNNKVTAIKTSFWGSGVSAVGGAVYGKAVNIRDNTGKVLVQNNVAEAQSNGTAMGGAIYVEESLRITGNAEVEFRRNVQQSSNQTILRSVYVDSKSAAGALDFSAAAGGSISFYDSLYAAPNGTSYALTADFNRESSATGSIIFSGKYAESDLLSINSTATAEEIAASRTSTIETAVTVHHGTLSVEDGAVLQSKGMSVADRAALQLKDGILEMLDSTSLNLSGMLLAEGSNAMSANEVVVADGATFRLTLSETNREAPSARAADTVVGGRALIALSASALTYDGTYTVQFNSMESLAEGRYVVMDFSGSEMIKAPEWSTAGVSVTGLGAGDSFGWSDDGTKLYLVHTFALPEPTTVTLSLLALVGMAARRRRR